MSMTKRDYIAAAEIIANANKYNRESTPVRRKAKDEAIREIMQGMMSMFAQDNSRFDRDRFKTACGYGTVPEIRSLSKGEKLWHFGARVQIREINVKAKTLVVRPLNQWRTEDYAVSVAELNL